MEHLLAIALGPVQEFIATARRTRDLYAGSRLLSEAAARAAKALAREVGAKTSFSPPPRTRRGWSGWPGRASPTFFWSGFRRGRTPGASGNKPWEPPGTTSGRGRRKFWGRVGTSFSGGRPWPRWKTSWRATTPTFPWRATIPGPGSGSWPSWPPAKTPGTSPPSPGEARPTRAPWTGPGRASSACPKRRRTTSGCGSACAPGSTSRGPTSSSAGGRRGTASLAPPTWRPCPSGRGSGGRAWRRS